jgi:hypothetical protein
VSDVLHLNPAPARKSTPDDARFSDIPMHDSRAHPPARQSSI